MKRLNVNIPKKEYNKFKSLLAVQDKEISEIIRKWIREYNEKNQTDSK